MPFAIYYILFQKYLQVDECTISKTGLKNFSLAQKIVQEENRY